MASTTTTSINAELIKQANRARQYYRAERDTAEVYAAWALEQGDDEVASEERRKAYDAATLLEHWTGVLDRLVH